MGTAKKIVNEGNESLTEEMSGVYCVQTKTGEIYVDAVSKAEAKSKALKKVNKQSDITDVYFDKAKTKRKDRSKK